MKALIPLILVLVGLSGGAGAGWFMRPPAPEAEGRGTSEYTVSGAGALARRPTAPGNGDHVTVKLPDQFLVPLVSEDRVRAVIVIALALELRAGHNVSVMQHEARLRASFLQALFDHANMGGFEGVFTSGEVLLNLRRQLRDIAREQLGDAVREVLITDLMRQDNA